MTTEEDVQAGVATIVTTVKEAVVGELWFVVSESLERCFSNRKLSTNDLMDIHGKLWEIQRIWLDAPFVDREGGR